MKGKLQNKSKGLFLLIWFGCMLTLTLLLMLCWMTTSDGVSVASMRWLQLGQSFSLFILPAFFMAYLWSDSPMRFLQLHRGAKWPVAVGVILTMLIALLGINLLGDWNSRLELPQSLRPLEQLLQEQEAAAEQVTEQLLSGDSIGLLLFNLFLIAFLPALGEELAFRGILQWLFTSPSTRANKAIPHIAIWATAILFSLIHFQFYGFIPRMLMGALFGYILAWTGSLWMPVLMHFVNNATVVILTFLANNGYLNQEQLESLGTGDTAWMGGISLVLTIGMIIWLRHWCRSNDAAPAQ